MALRFTFRQLEYFVAVGEAGSIARAAERVNVSSPSISAAIAQLEEEFGLPLFVRKHAHGLSLSQAGRQFLEKARRVLAEADGLNRLADDISGKVQGPLALGCLLTFAQMVLPPLRQRFEARFPDVSIRQQEMHQMEIFDKLRRAEIDVALSYDLEIPADLEFIPLRSLPPYVMVHRDHELAGEDQVSVEQLEALPMVLLDLPISSEYFLSFFSGIGITPNVAERTRDMTVMRAMVANGFGYAIANIRPRSDLNQDETRLKLIPLAGSVRPMQMGLVMAEGTRNILAVQAFVDHCRDMVAEWDYPGQSLDRAQGSHDWKVKR